MALNDRDYEEKRNFIRMTMNASAVLTINETQKIEVTCIDLSATGMAIETEDPVAEGASVNVNIQSPNAQFSSMAANGKVIRCRQLPSGNYELGVELDKID